MPLKFRDGFDAGLICKEISAARRVADGKVSFVGTEHFSWTDLLVNAIEFDDWLDEFHRAKSVSNALSDIALGNPITSGKLLAGVGEKLRLIKANKTYRVVYTITVIDLPPMQAVCSSGAKLRIPSNLRGAFATKVLRDREKIRVLFQADVDRRPYRGATWAFVSVNALNPTHAQSLARDGIDEIRGLLNLLNNRKKGIRYFFPTNRPLNEFLVTPFITVHDESGKATEECFWYDPNFEQPKRDRLPQGHRQKLLSSFQIFRQIIRRSPLRSVVNDGIRMYCRALDEQDWKSSFLQLWAALEFLACPNNAQYDGLIKRASSIFSNHDITRQFLQHLRITRNRIAHTPAQMLNGESLVDQLRILIEHMLIFYIRNPANISNMTEMQSFLDVPIGSRNPETSCEND